FDQNLVVILVPVAGRTQVEVVPEPAAMVLVRMGEEESIDVRSAMQIALQSAPELTGNVRGFVIRVVGGVADTAVRQKGRAALEFEERHVPVANAVMGRLGRHANLLRPRKRMPL